MTTTKTTAFELPVPPLGATGTADGYDILMQTADDNLQNAINGYRTLTAAAGGIAQYDCVYVLAAGTVGKAKADSASTVYAIGFAPTAISAAASGAIQTAGMITNAGWAFTKGLPVFIGKDTAGAVVQDISGYTAPGTQIQQVGVALSTTSLLIVIGPVVEVGSSVRVKSLPYNDATITVGETADYNTDLADMFIVPTGLSQATDFGAPGGSPGNGQGLIFRILSDSSARALTWNAVFVSRGATLPTTTVASKYLYVGFIYNSAASKWDCVAAVQEA